jgi:hypothetical protein
MNDAKVYDRVWTTYHPRRGYLDHPELDYIIEIDWNSGGLLLQRNNSLQDENDKHWTNDFYGNLVSPSQVFRTEEEAKEFLVGHYESELFELNRRADRIRQKINRLSFEG